LELIFENNFPQIYARNTRHVLPQIAQIYARNTRHVLPQITQIYAELLCELEGYKGLHNLRGKLLRKSARSDFAKASSDRSAGDFGCYFEIGLRVQFIPGFVCLPMKLRLQGFEGPLEFCRREAAIRSENRDQLSQRQDLILNRQLCKSMGTDKA